MTHLTSFIERGRQSLIPTSAPELPAITRLLALTRLMMDAATQLREQINIIHGELAARGIHSAKIDNATYSIETLACAYMGIEVENNWEGYGLTLKERKFADMLFGRLGKTVAKETILDVLYFDRGDTTPNNKIVDVFICKMRHKGFGPREKLPPNRVFPFEILTDWAVGYRMVRRDAMPIPEPAGAALARVRAERIREPKLPRASAELIYGKGHRLHGRAPQ